MYYILILFLCHINTVIGQVVEGESVKIKDLKLVKDVSPDSGTTMYTSNNAEHELKWHVGIYAKTSTPCKQICGGTLVTLNTVISGQVVDGKSVAIMDLKLVKDVSPDSGTTMYTSNNAEHELKWHVGIYAKTSTPCKQMCGGTLVTLNTVISAAHCFWNDKSALSAEKFGVGAGKLYRPWSEPKDTHRQISDISAIHIPPRFHGSLTNFQDDIAVVQLTQNLTASPAVFPACVSFNEGLDEEHLADGRPGTVMGWGLTQEDGSPSQVLKYAKLLSVPLDKCFKQAGPDFIRYITSDKICAGSAGHALCRGDSGGGLVFIEDSSPSVPYLRGVASTTQTNGHACNTAAAIIGFTHVVHHRRFLLKHVPHLERDCKHSYPSARVGHKHPCR